MTRLITNSRIISFLAAMVLLVPAIPAHASQVETRIVTFNPTADNYVHAGFPNENYGPQDKLFLVQDSLLVSRSRLLFQFDLSSIPSHATIDSATLSITLKTVSGDSPIPLFLSRITESWDESSVTWNTQPASTSTIRDVMINRNAPFTKTLDVTSFVENWVVDASQNNGMVIAGRELGSAYTYGFNSRENSTSQPKLSITYSADETPPTISNLAISDIDLTSATASLNTNEDATVEIDFGLSESFGRTLSSSGTAHSFTLFPLASGSQYFYRVRASDSLGNESTSATQTFSTPGSSSLPAPGSLVKLQDDGDPNTQIDLAVYYVGSDGKRHAFPNQNIYSSWYSDFSSVQAISVSLMADLPLGANVAYRPGVRLVKFTTIAKTYAVSRGGELRWITSEVVAEALYGTDWGQKIDDLNDAIFVNYHYGADIMNASEYDAQAEISGTATIDQDQGRS